MLFVAKQPEYISPNTNKWTELKHALVNSFANQRKQYCTISDVLGYLAICTKEIRLEEKIVCKQFHRGENVKVQMMAPTL